MNPYPDGWELLPLGAVASFRAGRTPARGREEYWKDEVDGIPWISIADLYPFGVVTSSKETISQQAFREVFGGRAVATGTLLMSFKLTIGRIATLGVPACHNEAIVAIYPKPAIDQRYLGYFLSQVDYAAVHDRQIKGNTLNRAKLELLPIAVPPMGEQQDLADVLDRIRSAIETERQATRLSTQLKDAAMRELFTHGLRGEPSRDCEAGSIPESWMLSSIGSHFSLSSGGTPDRRTPEYWDGGTIPWIKTAEVNYCVIESTEERITAQGFENSATKMLPKGTLVMAMYGQGVTRGRVATLGIEACTNQACAAFHPRDEAVSPRFLYHYLTCDYQRLRQASHGGQQQNLNLDILRDFSIAYPNSLDDQHRIVAVLDSMDETISIHEKKRAALEALFKVLLRKLMSGEIRVSDLDLAALKDVSSEQVSA